MPEDRYPSELELRKMYIGYFLANPQLTEGCTVGQCIADTIEMTWSNIMYMLGLDNHDVETLMEAGRKFV